MPTDEIFEKLNQIEKILVNLNSKNYKPFLKTKDACEYMSCSKNTLIKICIDNELYPIKISGVNYYKLSDLENLFSVAR